MPRNLNGTTSRAARKGAVKRKARQALIRKRPTAAPADRCIPHPFATLRLKPIAGADIYSKQNPEAAKDLYTDLQTSLQVTGNEYQHSGEKNAGSKLAGLLAYAKQELCPETTIDIEIIEDGKKHHLQLYQICYETGDWSIVEVKKLLASVRKTSEALFRLTLIFLKSFTSHCSVSAWYNGAMEMPEVWIEDEMEQMLEEWQRGDDEAREAYEEMAKDARKYKTGKAAELASLIFNSEVKEPKAILEALQRIKKGHPVRKAIEAGCALMLESGYSMYSFDHAQDIERDGCTYGNGELPFSDQFIFLYEYGDSMSDKMEEWVNSMANECGIMPPVAVLNLHPKSDAWEVDREDFYQYAYGWPMKLHHVFDLLQRASESKSKSDKLVDILP